MPPHPSAIMPQLSAAQSFFLQTPQTLAVPAPPHVSPLVVQPGQLSCLPHPSGIVPQLVGPHVLGLQTPQTLAVPEPPHVSPSTVQAPHGSCPPHPSPMVPQFLPSAVQLVGVQHLLL